MGTKGKQIETDHADSNQKQVEAALLSEELTPEQGARSGIKRGLCRPQGQFAETTTVPDMSAPLKTASHYMV